MIEFTVHHIGDYLAVTAALGIDELHAQLELRLLDLASTRAGLRVPCVNLAFNPHYKISQQVRDKLLLIFAYDHDALSKNDLNNLNAASLIGLLSFSGIPFSEKVDIINIALLWYLTRPVNCLLC
ncbi:unnamed protein product [Toxocara canis]|uniref:BACK domain-containing protein n=1 Tax=Toxocara canis TaxID=6265 RepID=A0A183VHM5_TOXCA|nr:unnamed protein product [Toxocara canis]